MAISETFFTRLVTELLPDILELLSKEVKKITKIISINLDMFIIHLSDLSFQINEISFDINKTKADLYHTNNSIGFHIADNKVNFTLGYDVILEPPILEDTGTVEIGYDSFNLDFILGMIPDKDDPEKLAIEVSESNFIVNPQSIKIGLKNNNDFNSLIVSVINAILPPVANLLGTAVSDYFQEGINLILGLIKFPLSVGQISLDFSLTKLPEITKDDFLSISSDGKIFK